MTFQARVQIQPELVAAAERTPLSVEFEAFWRALPKDGLVPNRRVFLPERAPRFLRHLLLCEALPDGQSCIRMRLVGSEFAARVQRDLKGHDYLQYLPEAYHAAAIESVRQIVMRPCGLWQIMPVHYERGYAHHIELTVFPLGPGPDGKHLLLILTQVVPALVMPTPTGDKVMATDTALAYRYIDLGAGVPPA